MSVYQFLSFHFYFPFLLCLYISFLSWVRFSFYLCFLSVSYFSLPSLRFIFSLSFSFHSISFLPFPFQFLPSFHHFVSFFLSYLPSIRFLFPFFLPCVSLFLLFNFFHFFFLFTFLLSLPSLLLSFLPFFLLYVSLTFVSFSFLPFLFPFLTFPQLFLPFLSFIPLCFYHFLLSVSSFIHSFSLYFCPALPSSLLQTSMCVSPSFWPVWFHWFIRVVSSSVCLLHSSPHSNFSSFVPFEFPQFFLSQSSAFCSIHGCSCG